MPSILNGLFAGRAGVSSHGTAIAVVSDNISNASTTGYKTTRAEFEDLVAGGQSSGKVIGSGSSISSVNTINEQGTLEFTGRPLDLAIDGNGYFVLADGSSRLYTRAGNFKIDSAGYVVSQNGLAVLGYKEGGSGKLEPININAVSQSSVATTELTVAANLDASSTIIDVATIPAVTAPGVTPASTTTYNQLNSQAAFSSSPTVYDSQGGKHTINIYYFHTAQNEWTVRTYVDSDDVDATVTDSGIPRQVGTVTIDFSGSGSRTAIPASGSYDITASIAWNSGASTSTIGVTFDPLTQYSAGSNILSVTQDGQGIGTVGSFSIQKDGVVFALLDNGQSATIGQIGLVNFSNSEGLTRVGGNLLQQSPVSGEPVVGKPDTGTFGVISSGSLELSNVDIASEFVKLITLQRGFQANSRIITTINQLLNEIIQLA